MDSNGKNSGVVITATEFKQNLGKYLEYVEQKQTDVVITKNGKKNARLTPYITDIEQYFTVRENALDYKYGKKRVSYEEFCEISEKSTLRMEYINGEIYLLSSPDFKHQEIIARLYLIFNEYFKGKKCKVVLSPFDVTFHKIDLDIPDVCQPDITVACDMQNNLTENGRYTGTPTLVVEILSRSTRKKDLTDKLNTYMMSGVKEYWVVDPKQETLNIYSFENYEMNLHKQYKRGDLAESAVFSGLSSDIEGLFSDLLV